MVCGWRRRRCSSEWIRRVQSWGLIRRRWTARYAGRLTGSHRMATATSVGAILLIAADKLELNAICVNAQPLAWPIDFAACAGDYTFIANGMGPELAASATEIALANGHFDAIVSTGYCGGLDPAL